MRNQTSDSKLETKLTSSSLNGSLDTAGFNAQTQHSLIFFTTVCSWCSRGIIAFQWVNSCPTDTRLFWHTL